MLLWIGGGTVVGIIGLSMWTLWLLSRPDPDDSRGYIAAEPRPPAPATVEEAHATVDRIVR